MIKQFKKDGYLHLKNALDKQSCEVLTNELKKLVENKKTIQDSQCPKSHAIHGNEIFDNLLQAMLPYFEEQSGLKLYPTYSYARFYNQQGEELKIHRDRESCEISATITLGFEGDVWSIYMGDDEQKTLNVSKIDMEIGDAVMYRGCDKYHWRETYVEGKWQAQIFLHYVDQNGPHAEWRYDKRESLGISKTDQRNQTKGIDEYYKIDNAISQKFCDLIINEYIKPEVKKYDPIVGDNEGFVDLNIRNTKRVMLPLHCGIGATLTSIGLNINNETWKFNITHSNQSEFLIYDIDGKYECHVDTFHCHSNETRKITVLAFLNDDFEGGKFYIQNSSKRFYPSQSKGTVLAFPSFMPHGVEPVTKGIRYSVVTWMTGPYFK
jgi:hypothetical protein